MQQKTILIPVLLFLLASLGLTAQDSSTPLDYLSVEVQTMGGSIIQGGIHWQSPLLPGGTSLLAGGYYQNEAFFPVVQAKVHWMPLADRTIYPELGGSLFYDPMQEANRLGMSLQGGIFWNARIGNILQVIYLENEIRFYPDGDGSAIYFLGLGCRFL